MSARKVLLSLGLCVLLAGASGIAIANEQEMLPYDATDYSRSADPSWPAAETDASPIREPVDTGAVPDMSESSPDENCCSDSGDPTFRLGGP